MIARVRAGVCWWVWESGGACVGVCGKVDGRGGACVAKA